MTKGKGTPTERLKEAEDQVESLELLLAETQAAFLKFQNDADILNATLMEFWYNLGDFHRKIEEALDSDNIKLVNVYLYTMESFHTAVGEFMSDSSKLFYREEQHSPTELFA